MKIIAFAGSTSTESINKQLVTYAASHFQEHEVELLDLNDYPLPLFSVDLEAEIGHHDNARRFLEKLQNADAIVASFAEHNGNYSAAFKNLLDWCTRIERKIYDQTPVVVMATSPGAGGGSNVIEIASESVQRFGGEVKATFSLPQFGDNFDTDAGKISDHTLDQKLKTALSSLV